MGSTNRVKLGLPDADWAERAVVVAKPGHIVDPANILAALTTTVANFKIPRRCVVGVELPRTTMDRIQMNLLRAQYGHLQVTGAS